MTLSDLPIRLISFEEQDEPPKQRPPMTARQRTNSNYYQRNIERRRKQARDAWRLEHWGHA